jgi:excisionase family DNA binding protein
VGVHRIATALLTTDDVSQWLRVRPSTVRRWTAAGKLPALRVGRQLLYRPDAVEAVLKHGTDQGGHR